MASSIVEVVEAGLQLIMWYMMRENALAVINATGS
jgi:hypothetical protein